MRVSGSLQIRAQLVLVLEELGQHAEQAFQKLRRRHRPAVRAPERGRRHVLDRALLAVGQLDLDLFGRAASASGGAGAGSTVAAVAPVPAAVPALAPAPAARHPTPGR